MFIEGKYHRNLFAPEERDIRFAGQYITLLWSEGRTSGRVSYKHLAALRPGRSVLLLLLIAAWVFVASAQSAPSANEPDFIVPARPTVSNPAEFQRPGVLQLEFGFSRSFHAPDVNFAQDVPMALRFAVSRRLLLEFDGDNPMSQTVGEARRTGLGDIQLGIQFVVQHEKDTRPGFSLAYYVKLPTASRTKGLGTGRVDHSFIALLSKNIGKTTVDFNLSYLLAGRTSANGHASSPQGALAASRNITKRWGIQGEISGSGRNDEQPGSLNLLTAVTWQVNRRLVLDGGARTGLTRDDSGVGIFAGMTVGIADLYRRHHHK